jgi:hypothetical protein
LKLTLTQSGNNGDFHSIGFLVVRLGDVTAGHTGRLLSLHDEDDVIALGPFQSTATVSTEVVLSPPSKSKLESTSVYIIPSTFTAGLESEFTLKGLLKFR